MPELVAGVGAARRARGRRRPRRADALALSTRRRSSSGCSQAVFAGPEPVLVRNYDFDPELLEGVDRTPAQLTGRRVLGMSDCLWGLLDGDQRRRPRRLARVRRPPHRRGRLRDPARRPLPARDVRHDRARRSRRSGGCRSRPPTTSRSSTAAARRPRRASRPTARRCSGPRRWRPTTRRSSSGRSTPRGHRERGARGADARAARRPATAERAFVARVPRVRRCTRTRTTAGSGRSTPPCTARPTGTVEYRWPGAAWRQSLDAFEEGSRTVRLSGTKRSNDCSHATPGQRYSARPSAGW